MAMQEKARTIHLDSSPVGVIICYRLVRHGMNRERYADARVRETNKLYTKYTLLLPCYVMSVM